MKRLPRRPTTATSSPCAFPPASVGGGTERRLRSCSHPVIPRALLVLIVSLLVLVGPVGTASAHDELVSSSPAAEATVSTTPTEVVLTFTNPPSGIGAEIIVSDGTGATWSEGPVAVVNNTAVQALRPGAPAGTYTTQWRVVSSDDHPIEGTYTFTSQAAQAGTSTGSESDAAAPTPGSTSNPASEPASESTLGSPAPASDGTAVGENSEQASSSALPPFVIYLGIGGLIVAAVLVILTRRRLTQK